MTPADRIIAQAMIEHQLDLLRLSAYSQDVALRILEQMGLGLESLLREGNLTEFGKARVNRLLADATEIIDRYYEALNTSSTTTLSGVARAQSGATERAVAGLNISLEAGVPSTSFVNALVSDALVEGAKTSAWWSKQSSDTTFKFANAIRQGLIQGETTEQIVVRVAGSATQAGVMDVARSNARSLVHSSIQQVANDARMATFQKNSDVVKGMRQISTLDSHTTEICIAYDGAEWDLEGEPIGDTELPFNGGPPRHWGCRSVLVPITKTFKELGLNIPELTPTLRATGQGPQKMTMRGWMDSRTKEQLNEQLGVGRAALYREGKITLTQLVDMKGNPMTLGQLERKYK